MAFFLRVKSNYPLADHSRMAFLRSTLGIFWGGVQYSISGTMGGVQYSISGKMGHYIMTHYSQWVII